MALFSITVGLQRMDVEFGSALAVVEGIMLLIMLKKRNLYFKKQISYLKTAFYTFSSYSVVKSFNFSLSTLCFLFLSYSH